MGFRSKFSRENQSNALTHLAAWWFQTFFIFHFIYGMSSFPLTHIFQDGYGTTSQFAFFLTSGRHRLRHGSTGAAVGIAVQPRVPGARGVDQDPIVFSIPKKAGDLWKV